MGSWGSRGNHLGGRGIRIGVACIGIAIVIVGWVSLIDLALAFADL